MPLKKWLICCHIFQPNNALLFFHFQHLINQKKWVPMWDDVFNLLCVHHLLSFYLRLVHMSSIYYILCYTKVKDLATSYRHCQVTFRFGRSFMQNEGSM